MKAILLIFLFSYAPFARAAPCENVTERPGLVLKRCGKLPVLYLEGKPVDRARRMGELLGGPLSPVVVHYFSEKVFDAVRGQPALVRSAFALFYNQVVRLLHRLTPAPLGEELDALAAGMGAEGIELRRAISLPDVAVALNALGGLSPFHSLPAAGCTSVAQRLDKKNGSHFAYGRNLDFAGSGIWDEHPLLVIVKPAAGSTELKHIVFGADGVIFGGITGVNEAGLGFAVQQNYSKDAGLSGVPMMFIGEMVLRGARNLSEAQKILEANRPAMLWTFVVTDLKTGEAIAVESSRRHFSVRAMDQSRLVQTNHIMGSGLLPEEFISVGTKMNSVYRMKKSFELLQKAPAGADPVEVMAGILAYQEDPNGELSAYHDILKAHTIQTILMESKDGAPTRFFVSQDEAPTAGGKFAAFDFATIWDPATLAYEPVDFARLAPEKRARQREISRAFHAYFDEHDLPRALELLAAHRTLDAALFRSVALYQQKLYGDSILHAEEALRNPRFRDEPAYILQSLQWVKLAGLWRMDKTAEARTLAAQLLAGERPASARLARLAEQLSRGGEPDDSLLQLGFEFFSGDINGRNH